MGAERMTLRRRIVASMLLVVAIAGGVSIFIGGYLLYQQLQQEAHNRVKQDLNASRAFYAQRLEAIGSALAFTALGDRFSQAVADRDVAYLAPRLDAVRRKAALDMLCLTDGEGRVVHRAHLALVAGDLVAERPLVARVLSGAPLALGTVVMPVAQLERESPELAARSVIPIVPTPRAAAPKGDRLDAGMVLAAAAPVHTADGRLAGVLWGGLLLNRDRGLVDQVRDTVFRDERFRGRLVGTATIFQHDVRISTNVLRNDGARAIGSRVSAEVARHVLERGRIWLGRAWVVNNWYISAYAPIEDVRGKVAGMLYVGVLEGKFQALTVRTLGIYGVVGLAGVLAAAFVLWRIAGSIARPVHELAAASAAIAQGDFSHTLPIRSSDEIGSLTRSFNIMARSLEERDRLLQERTRLSLTRSERLASIGRLAAGVAHEINNPLTGVLTFAHLLLDEAPEGSRESKDLQTIIDASMRCKEIVQGLLNFSRQNHPQKTLSDLNKVLREALTLTRNQASIHQVAIVEKLDPELPGAVMAADQIQEVAVNVIVNAIDAMPDGGTLTVRSRTRDLECESGVEFEIADSGSGIAPDDLDHVFDPFFTTKQTGKGTGLGLAVSYGVVTEHGGQIYIASETGQGTTVTVRLPVNPKEATDGP